MVDKEHGTLRFHVWYPGCPMEEDATGIPKPKDTEAFQPQLMILPCVGYGPCGLRLGYGGGFMDRTLAQLNPRPATAGVGFAHGFLPLLKAEPTDVPVDAMLTEEGVVWEVGSRDGRRCAGQPRGSRRIRYRSARNDFCGDRVIGLNDACHRSLAWVVFAALILLPRRHAVEDASHGSGWQQVSSTI